MMRPVSRSRRRCDFKVPRRVHVVDELPRVTMGKVSKVPLRALAMDLA